jgi:hypothetical protein
MNDELKRCANCGHEHRWGMLSHTQDGVPLYGPRACYCHCDRFAEAISAPAGGSGIHLPTLTNDQAKELWAQTSHLNAQVPLATRMAVRAIQDLGQGKEGVDALTAQWPEFMGLMISQLTDIRGAMVRDESKFANLISHTDEIVEAMRGVAQLKERLDTIYETQERILAVLERLGEKQVKEAVHMFDSKSAPLWNEPIVADSEPSDDNDS